MLTALLSSALWLGFVEALALGMLPLWCTLLSSSAERTLGYSRVLSFFLLSWAVWLLAQYAGMRFCATNIITVSLCLLLASHLCLRQKFSSWVVFLYDQKLSRAYPGYASVLLLLLLFRSCSPEIYWGEKPLDFSLFNYFRREEYLPAQHPWAAGASISYYYMGFFALAILQKISLLDPSIGYNLAIAFTGACLYACFESLLLQLRLSRLTAAVAAALLTLGSNFNPVYLAVVTGKELNFDLFWMTARNFTSPAFAEYPVWSLLFADLHPHVMAMPLVICLLGLAWLAAFQKASLFSHKAALTFTCGLIWGLLYSVNGWDFVSTAVVLAAIFGLSARISFTRAWFIKQLTFVLLLSAGALATVLPFRFSQENLFAAFWGWVTTSEFNSITHILLHQGVSLGIILLSGFGLLLLNKQKKLIPEPGLCLFALFPILIGICGWYYSNSGQPWHILIFSVLLSCSAVLFQTLDSGDKTLRYGVQLILAASCLISLSEAFYLIDRMNTIFKGYQLLWPLLGIAACILLKRFSQFLTNSAAILNFWKSGAGYLIYAACFTCLTLSIAGTIINLSIMLPMKRTSNDRFTLYGTSYLEKDNYDDAYLIRWLQKNVSGIAYVAEAAGAPYQEFSRVSMHTGLPGLLGWEYHSRQGGVAQNDLSRRNYAIRRIFGGNDVKIAYELLQYYGIDFVFIGKLENQNYPAKGIQKFSSHPELFRPVAWHGESVLYLTDFSPLKNQLIVAAHQQL